MRLRIAILIGFLFAVTSISGYAQETQEERKVGEEESFIGYHEETPVNEL